ncbi:hypothetical protein TrVGV298_012035 [Trichoderma virens]|nr:hypothetical protein TrVGV298_012035 [Trichoderma virens]
MPSSTPASSASAHPLPAVLAPSPGHHQLQQQQQQQHQPQGPSASPLHPPGAYYPPPPRAVSAVPIAASPRASSASASASSAAADLHPGGRVYDPTTDTTKERPIAASRQHAPQVATPKPYHPREPYQYPQPIDQQHQSSYRNGDNYSSPRARASSFNRRPTSPLSLSHSHPNLATGSHSPPQPSFAHDFARLEACARDNAFFYKRHLSAAHDED